MATNFQERGVDKCYRYWPATGSQVYGNVQVQLVSMTTNSNYNKTTFQVQLLSHCIIIIYVYVDKYDWL